MIGLRTVEDFVSYLRYEKRYSPHTLVAYQGDLKQFLVYLSDQYQLENWRDVEMVHVRSWIYHMAENVLDRNTINRKISCLRSFYQFLIREKHNRSLNLQSQVASWNLQLMISNWHTNLHPLTP